MPDLKTPDGKPVAVPPIDEDAVNRKFDAAMNDDTPDEQAPPKRAPKASAEPKARTPRTRTSKADKARTTAAPAEATPEITAKRAENATETVQILGGVLGMLGSTTNSPAFKADGYLFQHLGPKLGEAAAEVAKHDTTVARWLDKPGGGKVAAYMGLFGVVTSLGAQLAVNHGLLKPGIMGSVAPESIIAAFEQETPTEQAAAAAVPQEA